MSQKNFLSSPGKVTSDYSNDVRPPGQIGREIGRLRNGWVPRRGKIIHAEAAPGFDANAESGNIALFYCFSAERKLDQFQPANMLRRQILKINKFQIISLRFYG